jgi:hypothetical protein
MRRCSIRNDKNRLGSYVPPGLGLVGCSIPGLRCASPWAIFLRSLRNSTAAVNMRCESRRAIFRAVGHGRVFHPKPRKCNRGSFTTFRMTVLRRGRVLWLRHNFHSSRAWGWTHRNDENGGIEAIRSSRRSLHSVRERGLRSGNSVGSRQILRLRLAVDRPNFAQDVRRTYGANFRDGALERISLRRRFISASSRTFLIYGAGWARGL